MSHLINRTLITFNKQYLPCFLRTNNIYSCLIRQKPYLFHTSSYKPKDSQDFGKDSETQKLIKSMYEDFDIEKNETDSDTELNDLETNNKYSKNIDNFNENLTSDVKFSSDIIYDFDEERLLKKQGLWPSPEELKSEKIPKEKIVYERGKTGVFDVEELIDFLKNQKAVDIVVIRIPEEMQYVDYMVIATGKSLKHISVMSQHLTKLYKRKKDQKDRFVIVEGKDSHWVAMDMGNIALHIMREDVRLETDLETLWTVGVEFDDNSRNELEDSNPYSVEEFRKEQEGNV